MNFEEMTNCKKIYDYQKPISELISDTQIEQKALILRYLIRAKIIAAAPGFGTDEITGELIPGGLLMYCDGIYTWISDAIYYLDKYNIVLYHDYIEHVEMLEKARYIGVRCLEDVHEGEFLKKDKVYRARDCGKGWFFIMDEDHGEFAYPSELFEVVINNGK